MKSKEPTIATVVYLVKSDAICLAVKKESIHVGKKKLKKSKRILNGYGGKREDGDVSARDTAIRELKQESGVDASPHNLIPAGRVRFFWHGNTLKSPDMDVYFFFLGTWSGKPKETSEMGKPTFFKLDEIPYGEMMPADRVFLPKMLANEKVLADVYFGDEYEGGIKVSEKKGTFFI